MRESKSTLLLLVPVFLLLLTLGLLVKWGFQLNRLQSRQEQISKIVKEDPVPLFNSIKDSLQKIYTSTVNNLDSNFAFVRNNVDSLNTNLDSKILEYNKLKNEIASLLTKPDSDEDLKLARQKITELQLRVEMLNRRYKDAEEENKRYNELLARLTNNTKSNEPSTRAPVENNPVQEKSVPVTASFSASNLKLAAVTVTDDKEFETSDAELAEKITGSFTVRNNSNYDNAEVEVVVLKPDGQVLKNSEWETGTFETREGRKIYSYKTRFEYSKGETKRVNFSLNAENLPRGNYIMQVYHNGTLIGSVQKPLS